MARTYEEALRLAKDRAIQSGGTIIGEDANGYFNTLTGERLTPDQARELVEVDDAYVRELMAE